MLKKHTRICCGRGARKFNRIKRLAGATTKLEGIVKKKKKIILFYFFQLLVKKVLGEGMGWLFFNKSTMMNIQRFCIIVVIVIFLFIAVDFQGLPTTACAAAATVRLCIPPLL